MESFFHGKSSGLDPLNSYLSLPILINSKDHIEPAGIPSQLRDGKGVIFLLDSGKTGETAPMVQLFMEKMKEEGGFSKDKEYADRFDKPSQYKKRYDDFIDFRTTVFDRPTKPSFYLPKGKLHRRVEDPRHGVPYATRGGPEAQADITGETIENYLMVKAMQAGEPITQDEAVKLKWKLIYEGGGIDLLDKYGISGGVSKIAGGGRVGYTSGGLTRTVAPDSGPMSHGLRSLYIDDKDY